MTEAQGQTLIDLLTQTNTLLEAVGVVMGKCFSMLEVLAWIGLLILFFQAYRRHTA